MKDDEQVMVSFKVGRSTLDQLDSVAAQLEVGTLSRRRPNRTAALRYAISLAAAELAKKNKSKKIEK